MKQKRKWTNRNEAQMKVATLWEDSYLKIGGKKAGKKCVEEKLGFHAFTKEQQIEVGKMMGKRNYENGIGLIARSSEKKKQDAIKGGTASGNTHKGKFLKKWAAENTELAFKQNSKIGKTQGAKNVKSGHLAKVRINGGKTSSEIQYICSNCSKIVTGAVYHRWHGDNCKELEKINEQLSIIKKLNKNKFNSNQVVELCKLIGYNYKNIKYGILKNKNYIEQIHIGTNQTNPSIFKKIK